MGGGAMRTATRAVALAARGPWFDQAAAAARRSARPPPGVAVAAAGQAVDGAPKLSAASPAPTAPVDAASEQRASWDVDGWEVVATDEKLFEALRPAEPARLVFGPAPTLEEAKEATSDLKDALEELYLSPSATGVEGSVVAAECTLSESSCSESIAAKDKCTAIFPSAPRHVAQAFSLLQGCPEAQDVVASLASDKNVWDAVMKNEKVMEFYKTHQINAPTAKTGEHKEECNHEDGQCMSSSVGKEAPESSEGIFKVFMRSIKVKVTEMVTEMVNSLADFFKDFMGTTETKTTNPSESNPSESSHFYTGSGAYFIGLAVAVILVVLVKRG